MGRRLAGESNLLTTEYGELDDMENGQGHGTTTKIVGASNEHLSSKSSPESLGENLSTRVLMSREVLVESRVFGEEGEKAAPERVHFRA